jgi:glycosyltransferase involved in cell wall biosynthesis
VYLSLAVFAWNEEAGIEATLRSLFQQTLFAELSQRNLACEVLCVVNGCTDRTPEIAGAFFEQQQRTHPDRNAFRCRVTNLAERGKLNAWNVYVHSLSAPEASCLFMLDADILIHRPATLANMLTTLEQDPQASIAVDQPCKDISFKPNKSARERLSLGAARLTATASAQLCAQLYAIRAAVARNIYLPKDLPACEDGFIKAVVCTDFLTAELNNQRIRLAPDAAHTFEAYTSPAAVLKNQKRQIIGQTVVHLLIDQYLKSLPVSQRRALGQTLKEHETRDPAWLKRLIQEHLRQTRCFWRLYPGLLAYRFKRWAGLNPLQRMLCAPAVLSGFVFTLLSAWLAYRFLKQGSIDYWPQAQRAGLAPAVVDLPVSLELTHHNSK